MACSASPEAVYPGELIVVSGRTSEPKAKGTPPVWTWTATAGSTKPNGGSVTIGTAGLVPGTYTVRGTATSEPRARDGATCTVPFTVKAFDPPAVRCTAEPGSVVSGAEVQIRATGTSAQGRPLVYTYAASAGVVTAAGATASLLTAGLGNIVVEITCDVTDDLRQTASFQTRVTVAQPELPAIPQPEEMCTLLFTRDKKRPVRVDNEAKGCLDDLALRLTRQADARLIMVGNAAPDENPETAAQRVLNARQYLLDEKGIELARIEVRVGETSGRSVRDVLVPSGASFSEPATQLFDERAIHPEGEAYGAKRPGTAARRAGPQSARSQ